MKPSTLVDVERRLLSEYLDLPDLSLNLPQMVRLLSADASTCRRVLSALIEGDYLRCNDAGRYVRHASRHDLWTWKSHVRRRLAMIDRAPLMRRAPEPESETVLMC